MTSRATTPAHTIKIALDWSPNTFHTGLYCAISQGYYTDQNLFDVQLVTPDQQYSQTPAKQLEEKTVDLAICPSESCIAYHESSKMKLQAVYAILGTDASAIVSTRFDSIKQLGGGVYGSYNAKYEDKIVREMVKRGGGDGEGMKIYRDAGKFDLFEKLTKGEVDATWVFMPWEGVDAELKGVKLNAFRMDDYNIPYGYSPVIARNADQGSVSDDVLERFLTATRKGYEFAMQKVESAVDILSPHCEPKRDKEFLVKSQKSINPFYRTKFGGQLGQMDMDHWQRWVSWLEECGLLEKKTIQVGDLFFDGR